MTWTAALQFLLGLAVTIATLIDIFESVLVPGPSTSWLRIAARIRILTLGARRAHRRVLARGHEGFADYFGPLIFLLAFFTWVLLLIGGFTLMFHAAGHFFTPPLASFEDALYVAGSSFLTLGVSEVDAHSLGRWLILWAGLSGFSIITATVTYILQVQGAFDRREWRVLGLRGLAGRRPTGVALLEAFSELGMREELPGFFRAWQEWSSAVEHSHAAHPVLGYFNSVDAESHWLVALTTVMDAAALVAGLTDDPARGEATLMHRSGARTLASLCDLYGLECDSPEPMAAENVRSLSDRLARAGFVETRRHGVEARLEALLGTYRGQVAALAEHLGVEPVPLFG